VAGEVAGTLAGDPYSLSLPRGGPKIPNWRGDTPLDEPEARARPSSDVEQRTLVSETYVGGKLCERGDLVLNRLKAHLGVFARARQPG